MSCKKISTLDENNKINIIRFQSPSLALSNSINKKVEKCLPEFEQVSRPINYKYEFYKYVTCEALSDLRTREVVWVFVKLSNSLVSHIAI